MRRHTRGFALIDMIFVCGIVAVLIAIAIPRLTAAKAAAGSASAIGSLRAINSAQLTFALTCGNGFYAPNLTTLGTAPAGSNEPFIGQGMGASNAVSKAGYVIQVGATAYGGSPASCNGLAAGERGQGYKVGADASSPTSAPRYFGSNASGVVWEDTASLYATMPEIGEPPSGHPYR